MVKNPLALAGRIKLQIETPNFDAQKILSQLSAIVYTPIGERKFIWMGTDEANSIERLEKLENDDFTYGKHISFPLEALLEGFTEADGEVDIEGLDYQEPYLWLIGSHSSKRKKVSDKDKEKGIVDGKSLKEVSKENNRYLIARIPVIDGELKLESQDKSLFSAIVPRQAQSNDLLAALAQDDYLKSFIAADMPSKENGLDIEGFTIAGNKILLGLRGPVLRGYAILLEIKVKEEQGVLKLQPIGDKERLYKRHFLDLDGLGIREFAVDGDDLIILAGPTMDLDGVLRVFRLQKPLELPDNSFSAQKKGSLTCLFDILPGHRTDKAEGITLFPFAGADKSLLIVYDSPSPSRKMGDRAVLADVFAFD